MTSFLHRAVLTMSLAAVACAVPCLAVTQAGTQTSTFHVAIKPQIGAEYPRTGILTLTFHEGGIINGTYRGTSIKPDPLNNRITPVTGGMQERHKIWISIGPSMRFSGTLENGALKTSGVIKGRVYDLSGQRA